MTDKAKEYADKLLQHLHPAEPMECDASDLRQDIEAAYRAGYQAGTTDAHRKEWVQEQPTHFERGMT